MASVVQHHDEHGDRLGTAQQQSYHHITDIDPVAEKRLVRKLDRVVPVLAFFGYLLLFLDRSNIGNAETAGMSKDLGFNDSQYQWLLTIFYIPYIIFEWTALCYKLMPPRIWAFLALMLCGITATLQAAAFNWAGLMVCRWFLAMGETAFAPGIPYLFSFFYKRREIGLRIGLYVSAAPLATTFAGALAYGITRGHVSIDTWRLLFIVEGLPTVILAVIVLFVMPDSPDTAKFLTAEEKEIAKARAMLQTGSQDGKQRIGSISWSEVAAALTDPQTFIPPLMYFSCNVSYASLPVFLPAILTTLGYSSINAQGLTAPPYFLAFLVCLATTYLADRIQQRGLIIVVLSIVGGVGYILLATVHTVGVRYLGTFLAAAGVFPCIANVLPWVLNNQGTDTKRGTAIAVLNIIGQCGPILGTRLFPKKDAPYYVKGMATSAAFMFFNALLALLLRTYLARRNRQLERAEGAAAHQGEGKIGVDAVGVTELEGTHGYRYVL